MRSPELNGVDVLNLLNLLRRACDDDYIGLGASACPYGTTELMGEIAVRCATLREAIRVCFQMFGLVTDAMRFELIEDGETAVIEITPRDPARDPDHFLIEWHMMLWHKFPQWLIGVELSLDRAEFTHPMQGGFSSYAQMFGSDCAFLCPRARLTFASSYLDRRVTRGTGDIGGLRERAVGNFTNPMTLARSWKEATKRALRVDIATDRRLSSIGELAEEFGMNSQTLRRRLRAEGSSYRLVKAEVRRESALEAMCERGATLSEASLRAGFAEANGLTRALKISSGINSTELRDQVRVWQDVPASPNRH
jgi:AraC-like DNA-binding protein